MSKKIKVKHSTIALVPKTFISVNYPIVPKPTNQTAEPHILIPRWV